MAERVGADEGMGVETVSELREQGEGQMGIL